MNLGQALKIRKLGQNHHISEELALFYFLRFGLPNRDSRPCLYYILLIIENALITKV